MVERSQARLRLAEGARRVVRRGEVAVDRAIGRVARQQRFRDQRDGVEEVVREDAQLSLL